MKLLVGRGADVNFADPEEGWGASTPLINAATAGHRGSVLALLVLGAKVDARDAYGWTALHRAAGKGHEGVAQALLEAGADAGAKDQDGMTPADWARFCGHENLSQALRPAAEAARSEEELLADMKRIQAALEASRAKPSPAKAPEPEAATVADVPAVRPEEPIDDWTSGVRKEDRNDDTSASGEDATDVAGELVTAIVANAERRGDADATEPSSESVDGQIPAVAKVDQHEETSKVGKKKGRGKKGKGTQI
jgi:ankyrin repeat protein